MLAGGPSVRPAYAAGFPWRLLEYLSRACIACRHYAIDLNTDKPLTRQEARDADASFKGVRVHSTYKGYKTGGNSVSQKEVTLLSICKPYPRPHIVRGRRSEYFPLTQCHVATRGRLAHPISKPGHGAIARGESG